MAEQLVPLLATQVTSVQFPVRDRPMFRVEKVALLFNRVSGVTFLSTAIEIKKWVKKIAVVQAKVVPHLGLGPHRTWNAACQRSQ
jgi:hypothetical protein